MQPTDLRPENFAAYPPQARALATQNLELLRQLPLPLLPLLLREVSTVSLLWTQGMQATGMTL